MVVNKLLKKIKYNKIMSRGLKEDNAQATFVSILADGKFHLNATEDTQGAIKREYKDKDDNTKFKWELVYGSLEGQIIGIDIKEGEYGQVLYVTLDIGSVEEPNHVVINVGAGNNFGTEILKKIPNIDFEKDVEILPYAIENENTGKVGKFVVIKQDGEKINSYFQEGKGEDTKNLHDFPETDDKALDVATKKGDTARKKFWRNYFEEVQEFLTSYVLSNHQFFPSEFEKQNAKNVADFDALPEDGKESKEAPSPKSDKDKTLAEIAEEEVAKNK